MTKKIMALAALVAVAGLAAAAGALTVKQRQDTASLYAERYTVGELFVVDESSLAPVALSMSDAGIAAAPVELTSPLGEARVGATQDHWVYRVKLQESSASAVGVGKYSVELQVNGVTLSTLYVQQENADTAAIEGVYATFGLGATIQPSSLYYIVVKPYVPTGPTVAFTVESAAGQKWIGVSGSIAGVENPTLNVAAGATLRLTAKQGSGDSDPHNIGLRDSSGGQVVAYTANNLDADGEEIVWSSVAGTYIYRCAYHPDMKGSVVVA